MSLPYCDFYCLMNSASNLDKLQWALNMLYLSISIALLSVDYRLLFKNSEENNEEISNALKLNPF